MEDSRFIELQAHHNIQLTYCIRSTDTWTRFVCVEESLLYKTEYLMTYTTHIA